MTKALSNWKARVKRLIYKKNLSYEEVVKKEPLVMEDDLKVLKAKCESSAGKAKSMYFKDLYEMNIGTHHRSSSDYRVAIPKLEKDNATARDKGETPPFSNISEA